MVLPCFYDLSKPCDTVWQKVSSGQIGVTWCSVLWHGLPRILETGGREYRRQLLYLTEVPSLCSPRFRTWTTFVYVTPLTYQAQLANLLIAISSPIKRLWFPVLFGFKVRSQPCKRRLTQLASISQHRKDENHSHLLWSFSIFCECELHGKTLEHVASTHFTDTIIAIKLVVSKCV